MIQQTTKTQSTSTLLILGAGPKGIALAAKTHILAKLGHPVPNLHIIDRQGIASHWSGQAGYTDGNQLLGTRPEKDIGFPYLFTNLLDQDTHTRMAAVTQSFNRSIIEHSITEDLSLEGFTPKLHLPMLAGLAQGPGFPNLSCLGLLADRILASY